MAAIPRLESRPLEIRIATGAARPGPPTTSDEATSLAREIAGRLGRPADLRPARGVVLSGTGDPASLGRTARELAGVRARIRRLLRIADEEEAFSQVVVLADSRDRFEFADAALFGQAPLATRTAVLGLVDDRLVVAAWRDPDAASFRAATARALATASIVESGLLSTVSPPAAADGAPEADRPAAWFLEGLASQLAAAVASPNALEPRQRETGLRFLRSGGDPRRIFALAPDDPQWIALDGVAQSVAFLAVQRLAEDAPANLDRLIGALRAGRSWPEAWRTSLGGTPSALAERLVRHHAVND